MSANHDQGLILIAERDQKVRDLQLYVLNAAGYAVEFADDGAVAFARAREASPSVVVAEILLPKLDGLTLCRQLCRDPQTTAIPVVVFSILAAAQRAEDAGAAAFLRKPFIESTFMATIAATIATHSKTFTEHP